MIRLFRFLLGCVKFQFSNGFAENFINLCFENGIDIKEIELNDNGFTALCSIKTYKKLHTLAKKCGGRVKIIKKSGLPFLLHPFKNRFGFLVGIIAFSFILSLLTGFVWQVQVNGNDSISDSTIYTYLELNGLRSGAMWSNINKDKLCWKMMSDFDELAWIHINKFGTTAVVEINETRNAPVGDDDKLKGINVYRKEIEVVAYREQSKLSIKDTKTYSTIYFYWLKLPLYFKETQGDVSEFEENFITLNNITLPIGYTKSTQKWLNSQKYDLTDDELTKLAKKKLEYQETSQFDGYEIINKSVDINIDNDKCVLKGAYIIRRK